MGDNDVGGALEWNPPRTTPPVTAPCGHPCTTDGTTGGGTVHAHD